MDPGCYQELAYQYYHDLFTLYVMEEGSDFTRIISAQDYDRSVNELIQHMPDRIEKTELLL